MSGFQQQQKITEHIRVKNNAAWRGNTSIGASSDMTQVMKLSGREIEIIMVHMLRTLIDKADNMHKQVMLGRKLKFYEYIKRKC